MDILNLLGFRQALVRCTHCYYEFHLSPREVRLLEKQNTSDTVCPVKEECHICHIGFMIPVKYTDKTGKKYLFHEIKPKIKNLDPNTVMERILRDHDHDIFFFPDQH
ncbi:MAG: hypothetical protein AABZ11_04690 [Nitrospinota bacterium]